MSSRSMYKDFFTPVSRDQFPTGSEGDGAYYAAIGDPEYNTASFFHDRVIKKTRTFDEARAELVSAIESIEDPKKRAGMASALPKFLVKSLELESTATGTPFNELYAKFSSERAPARATNGLIEPEA